MVYLLDANVFIQAKNFYYGFDFCPAFWEWLDLANKQHRVFSVEKVLSELIAKNDELAQWAKHRANSFFLRPDAQVLAAFNTVSEWVRTQNYEQAAISRFFQSADYYLVAHALAHGFIVVTHEIPSNTKGKVKIPNVCTGLNIGCMMLYEVLRQEGVRFVLDSTFT